MDFPLRPVEGSEAVNLGRGQKTQQERCPLVGLNEKETETLQLVARVRLLRGGGAINGSTEGHRKMPGKKAIQTAGVRFQIEADIETLMISREEKGWGQERKK